MSVMQRILNNSVDVQRRQKPDSSASHLWAVLLAGGDGVRLQELTRRIAGDSRPKQFCRIVGEQSLFRETERHSTEMGWRGKLRVRSSRSAETRWSERFITQRRTLCKHFETTI